MPTSRDCWGYSVLEYLRSQRSCVGFKQKEPGSLKNVPVPVVEGSLVKERCMSSGLKASPLARQCRMLGQESAFLYSCPFRAPCTLHRATVSPWYIWQYCDHQKKLPSAVHFMSPNFKSAFALLWLLEAIFGKQLCTRSYISKGREIEIQ